MRKTILVCMILVPFIPFMLALSIGYTYFTTALRDTTIARMNRILEDHRHMIETFLFERRTDLEFAASNSTYAVLSRPENVKRAFDLLQAGSSSFVDLGVFDVDGTHVAYHGPYELTGKNYRDADWFLEVLKKGYYVSDVFLGYRNVPHFVIAVLKSDENRKWILRATIDPYVFNGLVKKVRIGETGECYIRNALGVLQTEKRSGGEPLQVDAAYPRYNWHHEGIRTFVDKDENGKTYLYATAWMKEGQWLLVVRQEKRDALRSLRSAAFRVGVISIFGGTIIVLLAVYLTRRIIHRMEQTDVEKEQLEGQLIQAGRLAEIGEMAAGFAHEINNPLQIMKSEQALILELLSDIEAEEQIRSAGNLLELEDSLRQIDLQIGRCAEITGAILRFSRHSQPALERVDLRCFIHEITKMVAKKASVAGIIIEQHISDQIPAIYVDPAQLQQVLLNLYNNAVDAIIARHPAGGGRLQIACTQSGKVVEITISDNGCGIDPENIDKIFRPFFTTKPVGKGTGLGLSVCYGIVDGMGGRMTVSSTKDSGTTFTIRLPAAAHHET